MDMEQLSKSNSGLIFRIACRYRRLCELDRATDLDDLMQAGHIGLWKAAETYDANGGKSWAGWAVWHIQREMRALLGVASARRRADLGAVSLNKPLDEPDGDTLGDLLADDSLPNSCDELLRAEARQEVCAAVGRLPTLERTVIEGHRLRGLGIDQLAAALNRPAEEVRRAMWRGMNALRKDKALRSYRLDLETHFYAHKGLEAFNRDWTSTTEAAALWRIGQERK
ncbi:MAG: sigma-70 family RNA polymerase sigma factor [Clostridia bacterium]|nr:sigma-70 family RNA polymerase sigma factor [Clostridia bacterium]